MLELDSNTKSLCELQKSQSSSSASSSSIKIERSKQVYSLDIGSPQIRSIATVTESPISSLICACGDTYAKAAIFRVTSEHKDDFDCKHLKTFTHQRKSWNTIGCAFSPDANLLALPIDFDQAVTDEEKSDDDADEKASSSSSSSSGYDIIIRTTQNDSYKPVGKRLRGHNNSICAIEFHDDRLISGSRDHAIRVWCLTSRTQLFQVNLFNVCNGLQFFDSAINIPSSSSEEKNEEEKKKNKNDFIAAATDNSEIVCIPVNEDFTEVVVVNTGNSSEFFIDSSDSSSSSSSSKTYSYNKSDLKRKSWHQPFKFAQRGYVMDCTFHSGKKLLASSGTGVDCRIFNVDFMLDSCEDDVEDEETSSFNHVDKKTGRQLYCQISHHPEPANEVSFSRCGNYLVTFSTDGCGRFFEHNMNLNSICSTAQTSTTTPPTYLEKFSLSSYLRAGSFLAHTDNFVVAGEYSGTVSFWTTPIADLRFEKKKIVFALEKNSKHEGLNACFEIFNVKFIVSKFL